MSRLGQRLSSLLPIGWGVSSYSTHGQLDAPPTNSLSASMLQRLLGNCEPSAAKPTPCRSFFRKLSSVTLVCAASACHSVRFMYLHGLIRTGVSALFFSLLLRTAVFFYEGKWPR